MITGTMLVKNEANRYLEKALDTYKRVCDRIVILDDGSTDNTVEICEKYGAIVYKSDKSMFEVNESIQRQKMWEIACANSEDGDWILCIDADEELTNAEFLRDACKVADSNGDLTIALRKYDMWDETHYRDDRLWNAHLRYTPVAHKYIKDKDYNYRGMKLHGGSFPVCAYAGNMMALDGIKWLHWAYAKQEDRIKKYAWYKKHDTDGNGNQEQYDSILDKNVNLKSIAKKILIGAPVRQSEEIFREYLKSLDNLEKPCQCDRFFYLHNSPNLAKYLKPDEYLLATSKDDYKRDETTHHWKQANLQIVTYFKNELLKRTLEGGYDYFLLVDSDLMLHPKTLASLLEADKKIVAEVFWTKWQPDSEPLPNAWDFDQATSYAGSYERWKQPGIYRVGGTGACILIHRSVIESGVNYNMLYNLSLWGEDRGFCIRAVARDYGIWLDTHYPAVHLYRESEYQKYVENGGYEAAFS